MALLTRNWFNLLRQPPDRLANWRADLELAHYSLQAVYNQFDQALENDLIDASAYEIKAAEIRYNWLLRQAKAEWIERAKEG